MTQEQITRMLENVSENDMQNILGFAKNKAAEEAAIANGQTPEKMIEGYLNHMAKIDPQLAEVYPNNPDGKTIEDCCMYIEKLAKGKAANHSGFQLVTISSFDVFQWATQYFLDKEIKKIEKPAPTPVKTYTSVSKTPTIKLDADALLKEKKEWEKTNNEKIDAWEKENNRNIDKFEWEHPEDLFGNKPENPYKTKENPYLKLTFPKQALLDHALAQKDKTTKLSPAEEPKPSPEPEPVQEPESEDKPDPDDEWEKAFNN